PYTGMTTLAFGASARHAAGIANGAKGAWPGRHGAACGGSAARANCTFVRAHVACHPRVRRLARPRWTRPSARRKKKPASAGVIDMPTELRLTGKGWGRDTTNLRNDGPALDSSPSLSHPETHAQAPAFPAHRIRRRRRRRGPRPGRPGLATPPAHLGLGRGRAGARIPRSLHPVPEPPGRRALRPVALAGAHARVCAPARAAAGPGDGCADAQDR